MRVLSCNTTNLHVYSEKYYNYALHHIPVHPEYLGIFLVPVKHINVERTHQTLIS